MSLLNFGHRKHKTLKQYLAIFLFDIAFVNMIYALLHAYDASKLRYQGPVIFGFSAFFPLSITLFLLIFLANTYAIKKSSFLFSTLIFTGFLLKYMLPYYIFNGYVNYDTPFHYLSALYLRDHGIDPSYHYHMWPAWLLLNSMFTEIFNNFPINVSVIALASKLLISLSIYLLSKRYLMSNSLILTSLIILLIVEPFTIHPSPLLTSTTLTILAILLFLNLLYSKERERAALSFIVIVFSLTFYHSVMPIALLLSILSIIMTELFINKLTPHDISRVHIFGKVWLWSLISFISVLAYNVYLTLFVIRTTYETLVTLVTSFEAPTLTVHELIIEGSELTWQYVVLGNINRSVRYFLIIPSVIVAFYLFNKNMRARLTENERAVFAITVVGGVNVAFYIIFNIFLYTGLVERLYQLSYILLPIPVAYFQEILHNDVKLYPLVKRVLSLLMSLSMYVLLFLSMFTAPSYTTLYASALGEQDLNIAQWIASHSPNTEIILDGNNRINELTALYLYPDHIYNKTLKILQNMEVNAFRGVYNYPYGAIITTRKPITIASPVRGLTDIMLERHINNLSLYLNKVFSNGICESFMTQKSFSER